jgi:hypothetical protein
MPLSITAAGAFGLRNLPRAGAPAVLVAVLLAAGSCGRTPQTVSRYPLSFQNAGAACASGTCGLQAAEFAVIQLPEAITLDPGDATAARLRDGRQRVATRLTQRGFSPAVIVLQRGVPAELEIRSGGDARGLTVTVPVYAASVRLAGEATILEVVPDFDFTVALQGRPERLYIRVRAKVDRRSAREATVVAERYLELVRQLP